jgi:putative membrane protein
MRLKRFISASDRHAIENAVRAAEKNTSGQIVPAVVLRSSRYDWIGYRAALLGWVAATMVVIAAYYYRPFLLDFWETLALQVSGIVLGWILSRFHFGVRLFVSDHVLADEVSHAAHASFVHHGVVNTQDRNGVLVFVSLRERRVLILADQGIHVQAGEDFWKAETDRIVQGIRAGKPAEGIVAAIESIGGKLAAHFPPRPGQKNELPDRLRTD